MRVLVRCCTATRAHTSSLLQQSQRCAARTSTPITPSLASPHMRTFTAAAASPTSSDFTAEAAGPLNFSFSGAGFLTSYHFGIAQGLDECGALTSASKVAGASGGAVAALTIAAKEVNVIEMQEDAKELAALCRTEGTLWKLEARVRATFDLKFRGIDLVPINERLTIVAQRVWPTPKLIRYTDFDSPDALADRIIASCYIPYFLGTKGTTRIGNELFIDASLFELTPVLPGYIMACAFPAKALWRSDYEISPSLIPNFPYSVLQLTRAALSPPSPAMLDNLYRLGKESAFRWADSRKL